MCSASVRLILVIVVAACSWKATSGFSQAPSPAVSAPAAGVFVLDDCDEVFKGKDRYEDNLTLFTTAGKVGFRVSGINTCQMVGSCHLIATDMQRQCVWLSEPVGNCIKRYDLAGKVSLTVPLTGASAIALHPETGNLWVIVAGHTIYGNKIVVLDEQGQELITHEVGGFDIVYDRTENAFWTVNKNVTKIFAADGQVDFSHRIAEWCAVSIDIDPQSGSAWIAVRDHPDVPGSKNQLVQFSRHGKQLAMIELGEKDPFCVSVDPVNGGVWMVNFFKSIERFSAEGKLLVSHPMQALAVLADRAGGAAWVVTATQLQKLDSKGEALLKTDLAGKTGQAWIGADD